MNLYDDQICSNYVSAIIESVKNNCSNNSFAEHGCYGCIGLEQFKTCDFYYPVPSVDVIDYIGKPRHEKMEENTKRTLDKMMIETRTFKRFKY